MTDEELEDGTLFNKLSTIDNYISPGLVEKAVAAGKLLRADTLEELVERTGLPKEQALASLARYNALCRAGRDLDYGKRALRLFPGGAGPVLRGKICARHHDRGDGRAGERRGGPLLRHGGRGDPRPVRGGQRAGQPLFGGLPADRARAEPFHRADLWAHCRAQRGAAEVAAAPRAGQAQRGLRAGLETPQDGALLQAAGMGQEPPARRPVCAKGQRLPKGENLNNDLWSGIMN